MADEKAHSVKDILSNNNYVIPIYQRNYDWGKQEISQLIKDIVEFFNMQTYDESKTYYLGSLVCFKREDKDGTFELIDGQQRHTTLTLINIVLKNYKNSQIDNVDALKLKFDSRKNTQRFLEAIYQNFENLDTLNIDGIGNMKSAVDIIRDELRMQVGEDNILNFAKYFYNNVKLFRVEVPYDTDLNHYFEIMNNRGEQLEKHEIIKALLMEKIEISDEKGQKEIEKTKNAQYKFAAIWDACSDMGDYVCFNLNSLFGINGNIEIDKIDFDSIEINQNNEDKDNSLSDILLYHTIPNDFPKKEKYTKEKYKSIIDFPNFLLQVLKLRYPDISLDDKKLLEQFQKYLSELNFSIDFITNLLKCRILFDKYIIKQDLSDADDNKQNWGIRKSNSSFDGTIKTFDDDDELVKLQVMLYYSDSTNTYNTWLYEILNKYLFFFEGQEDVVKYTLNILAIAENKFDSNNLSYPDISIFNLYFIDFLLWKLYITEVQSKEGNYQYQEPLLELKQKIFKKRSLFNTFKFRQLSSKEHLFPQAKSNDFNVAYDCLNCIGNLCLISSSQNSQGNKDMPIAKKKSFESDNSSLKRLIMFESFEDDKWEQSQIEKHKEEIRNLIDW
ncbi:DUF262 domain-containing protein [Leadbettera azotonutricia]|uniref:DUF262 domain-containing protein n=1 Tax=Leadbettera azotonutricia (strain ATCC BAA-888 / DSM 13862 / ZAS-9) TaxID=545695 RepID=F5YAM7_LEAAZ|nr:DUF262 domain-containing protein [Leadbettera azotonutricia]AEF82235.1 conserved hypothetical protein [Leadbettera azotonutricia ZAS-9]